MSLRARLERLERLENLAGGSAGQVRSRIMERLLHAHESARREIEGLEPLPDLPYTDEDREDDRRFLEETIPTLRKSVGWQTEEGQSFCDQWEQHIRDNLAKGD